MGMATLLLPPDTLPPLQLWRLDAGSRSRSAMERESRSRVLSETASCAGTPRSVQSTCSLQRRYSSRSILKPHDGALDMSPRFSYCKPAADREKMFNRRHSLNLPEQLPGHYSRKATERTQKASSKSVADLVGEIAALEQEVIRKELHLLALYRRAFDQYVSESCSFTSEQVDQEFLKSIDEGALRLRDIKRSAAFDLPTTTISGSEEQEEAPPEAKAGARHSSLVNFLSASISEYVPKISCKLSEDILGCIAAVYCKLSGAEGECCVASPSPSVSSWSTFSPRRRNDSWSPRSRCNNFDSWSPRPCGVEKESGEQSPGVMMVVVPRIRVDADTFEYASKMLETTRSLIQRLEKVDPVKMTHEEQLCFWINIHNALVMHAFLAYGLHDKRMKSTDMILKAAYNVGGQSVNAQTIQNSILGCRQSHRPSLWVRALFTPAKRSAARHPYALQHPEPVAHFALSTGAFSDPPVRLYTAKKIQQQLEAARTEFIRGSVAVRKQALLLPKVLHCYARDAALELRHLVELVCETLSDAQQKQLQLGLRRRAVDKCVEWMPYKSSFRYVVHRDLADD
ncbi:Ternary complex factor-like [Zea mays]|uniref:Ternary complex factor-like n=4 Tax=Zea mays TaxID=4577 RepID=A0A1D6I7D6_MAIZE|nr:Ternary complex factor-like [Zea mays]